MIFANNHAIEHRLEVEETEIVDWMGWGGQKNTIAYESSHTDMYRFRSALGVPGMERKSAALVAWLRKLIPPEAPAFALIGGAENVAETMC